MFLPPAPDFPETLRFSEHAAAKFPSFTMDMDDGDNASPPLPPTAATATQPLDDLQDITNHARVNRNSTYVRNTNTNGSHAHDDVGTTLNTQTSTTLDTDSSGLGVLGMNMNMGGLGLPPGLDQIHQQQQQQHGAGNMNNEVVKPWDKPMDFDTMASLPPIGGASGSSGDDDDDDAHVGFDVPDRLTIGPGAAAARLDLHRCTIRVHKQLVDQIKTHSMKSPTAATGGGKKDGKNGRTNNKSSDDEDMSRCQGELWLKSRVPMRGWKKRYGSIVDHAYFGPVLFLFKYDAKGNVTLTNSMMIVLVDSHVRLGKNTTTKDREYRCEFVLKTTKRRYTIAANHTMRRDYWLRNLESIQQQASTNSFS